MNNKATNSFRGPVLKLGIAVVIFSLSIFSPLNLYADQLTVGVAINDLNNPFFLQIVKGAKRKADQLSHNQVTMLVADSGYDVQRQRYQIQQMIDRKANIILITAADQQKLKADILHAIQKGVQVIAVDVEAEGAVATVATDNVKAGFLACEFLARSLNYNGTVALIDGPPVSAVSDRMRGCQDALATHSSVKVVRSEVNGEGSQPGGSRAMESLLKEHSDVAAVFAINDPSAIGAELFAQRAGNRDLLISSVDGAPIIQNTLKNSASLVSATAAQYPDQMAEKAVALGFSLMSGVKLDQKIFLIDPSLITKENVLKYKGWND